jgi:hypothetical protein
MELKLKKIINNKKIFGIFAHILIPSDNLSPMLPRFLGVRCYVGR